MTTPETKQSISTQISYFPNSFPPTIIRSYIINNVQTEFIIQRFAERVFIGISQLEGKIGTYISSSVEYSMIDNSTTYHLSTLLGKRDDLLEVYARQISERIYYSDHQKQQLAGAESLPLLIGIALKKGSDSGDMFKEIINTTKLLYEESLDL